MGVTGRALVRRLRTWGIGGPVARGTAINTSVSYDDHRFLLAFVRMGGESRPWGVAWKSGDGPLRVASVGEPRAREFVDEMLVDLAEDLAAHLGHPYYADVEPPDKGEPEDMQAFPQVWVPNSSHIDMLHFLAYAYVRRKGDTEADIALRMLGRMALHLFLESRRPGQQIIMDAAAAMRSAFDFPCEDARQAHLGLLLARLDNRGDRDRGLAAASEAERLPVSTSLKPDLERRPLTDLVEQYNASRNNRGRGSKAIEKKIHAVLAPELERRIELVESAIGYLEDDERDLNPGLAELVHTSASELFWRLMRAEKQAIDTGSEPFAPSPETDWNPKSAAHRYFSTNASLDRAQSALIHFDRELEAEAINAGRAFRGIITSVADEGGRATIPVWTVVDSTPGALSLRQWDKVCVVGAPKREATIREITPLPDGSMELTVEITNLKKKIDSAPWPHRMAGADQSWLGLPITLIATSYAAMTDKKAAKALSSESAPADWMVDLLSRRPAETEDDE